MTPRQEHAQKLESMMAEYRTTKSRFRKNDLRKGIRRMMKELKIYDFYTTAMAGYDRGVDYHC